LKNLDDLKAYAMSFVGVPYKYGGRNRLEGLDCSQFVTELLIREGLVPHGTDLSAQAIFDFLTKNSEPATIQPQLGAIAFYGKTSDQIVHVAFCITDRVMLEAGGGDHTTLTLQNAIDRSACIRERQVRYRKDYFCSLMPLYVRPL
jgi:cell wall-associated NlpC family hydrolase